MTKPLVLSYPRSGMNWLRHSVETLTGLKTPGAIHHDIAGYNAPWAFSRAHDAAHLSDYSPDAEYNRMLILLRDPSVSYMRRLTVAYRFEAYIENIKIFDSFSGDKLVAYYDDIITQAGLYTVLDWFGYEYKQFDDYERAIRESSDWYARHFDYERQVASDSDRIMVHKICLDGLGPRLYDKYLGRYRA